MKTYSKRKHAIKITLQNNISKLNFHLPRVWFHFRIKINAKWEPCERLIKSVSPLLIQFLWTKRKRTRANEKENVICQWIGFGLALAGKSAFHAVLTNCDRKLRETKKWERPGALSLSPSGSSEKRSSGSRSTASPYFTWISKKFGSTENVAAFYN